jgi:hypothetical protein
LIGTIGGGGIGAIGPVLTGPWDGWLGFNIISSGVPGSFIGLIGGVAVGGVTGAILSPRWVPAIKWKNALRKWYTWALLVIGVLLLSWLAFWNFAVKLNLRFRAVGDDDLAAIKWRTHLQTLWMNSRFVTDQGVAHLQGMTNMRDLSLWGASITDDGLQYLKEMKDLRRLNLGHTKVTAKGLSNLYNLARLKTLVLDGLGLKSNDRGVIDLQRKLPEVKIEGLTDQGG